MEKLKEDRKQLRYGKVYGGIVNKSHIQSVKKLFKDIETQASQNSPISQLVTPSSQPSQNGFDGNLL